MFLIPVGIEGYSLRRMPYVAIAIAAVCGLAFLATWVVPKNPYGESQARLEELVQYWSEHPNAQLPPSVLERLTRNGQAQVALMHDRAVKEFGAADADVQAEVERQSTALLGASDSALVRFGLKYGKPLSQVGLLTHMFLHLGWMHLIFNMLFFYMTGPLLEDVWGRPFFTGFYVLGGVAAALAEYLLSKQQAGFMVGASGAIAACMGAFAVRFSSARVRMAYLFFIGFRILRGTFRLPAWFAGVLWVGAELWALMRNDQSGVAVLAHIGGFGFGVAFTVAMSALGFEKKYLEEGVENADVVYARPVELDAAIDAFAQGDYATARRNVSEVLKKSPELTEAEVLLYKIEKRQNLGNAANARLDRMLNRALQKEEGAVLAALVGELGDEFEPASLRAATAARLLPRVEHGNQVSGRVLGELLEVASAAPGAVGAALLLRRADEAMNAGLPEQARGLVDAARQRAPDAPELADKIAMIERRIAAEPEQRAPSVTDTAYSAPRFRSAVVVGADAAGLVLQDEAGREAKLPWERIQAVAVALAPAAVAAAGAAPRYVPVTDLVLGWGNALRGAEVLRISAPSLGLGVLFPGVPPQQAYGQWLKNAIERSGATVLPDRDAVLSGNYTRYGSVEEMTAALYSVQI